MCVANVTQSVLHCILLEGFFNLPGVAYTREAVTVLFLQSFSLIFVLVFSEINPLNCLVLR